MTTEQSIQLREQVLEMDNQFDLILSDKNNKISQLKLIIENYKNDNVAVSGNNESNSISSINESVDIKLFPNPAKNLITIYNTQKN